MKRISLLAAIAFFSTVSFAQKYDDIKAFLMMGQLKQAKELLDKKGDEKFYSKPEGILIKSYVYSLLALDSAAAADAPKNMATALDAFNQFKEKDPSMKLLEDNTYRNTPYNIYAAYFNTGVKDINDKSYDQAYDKFKKVVDLSDLLISKKIQLPGPVDTNAVYYAGILAETVKQMDEAVKYNTRLADLKVTGANYETVYQGLVRYYATKNDQANFDKYKALGAQLYPQSEFFKYTMLDFAIGTSENFDEKIKNLETILAASPDDYKANLALGEAIFDTLDSHKEGAVPPANYDELEVKMLAALKKAASVSPDEVQPLLLMGDHFTTKSEKIGDDMRAAESDLIKKGAKATAADKQKFADVKKKYDEAYDLAKDNFEKVADMFAKKGTLDAMQKRQYRIIVGNLAQYYSYKREGAKGAELNKVIAQEAKYNKLYDDLKK
ncbi:MAG: hypothetical protein QM727_11560 [Niabella sp.]